MDLEIRPDSVLRTHSLHRDVPEYIFNERVLQYATEKIKF